MAKPALGKQAHLSCKYKQGARALLRLGRGAVNISRGEITFISV
jgi:hypothetical protein